MTNDCDVISSSFGLRASFGIRHSCFVIPPDIEISVSLDQSV